MTVFQIIVGADWHAVMNAMIWAEGYWTVWYFLAVYVFGGLILMTCLVSITIESFITVSEHPPDVTSGAFVSARVPDITAHETKVLDLLMEAGDEVYADAVKYVWLIPGCKPPGEYIRQRGRHDEGNSNKIVAVSFFKKKINWRKGIALQRMADEGTEAYTQDLLEKMNKASKLDIIAMYDAHHAANDSSIRFQIIDPGVVSDCADRLCRIFALRQSEAGEELIKANQAHHHRHHSRHPRWSVKRRDFRYKEDENDVGILALLA